MCLVLSGIMPPVLYDNLTRSKLFRVVKVTGLAQTEMLSPFNFTFIYYLHLRPKKKEFNNGK